MNGNERFGPVSYEESLDIVSVMLAEEKFGRHSDRVMIAGVEGLSCTGKSFMASKLESSLRDFLVSPLHIEGDLFQRSREESMRIYNQLLADLEGGAKLPPDFPSQIWNFDKMGSEIIGPTRDFSNSSAKNGRLILRDVLEGKIPGTEHDKTYSLDRKTLILVSGIYLRQVEGFDFILYLKADPEILIRRKIERTAKAGSSRDPSITRKMVTEIEYPAMLAHETNYPIKRGITLDVNDFDRISGERT